MSAILVVDDSPSARSFLANILQNAGYAVSAAEHGREALQLASESRFDLILTDINMPGMSGYELIEATREKEEYRLTPIIIVSSGKEDTDKRRGYEAGANLYITKPCQPDQIIQNVKILSHN